MNTNNAQARKRALLSAILMLCLLTAAGCIRKIADKTPAEPTLAETICTAYDGYRGSTREVTEIRAVGDFLIAEIDEYDGESGFEMAWYAEEIVPDDPAALSGPASAARENGGIPVTIRRYSSFSNAGEYWDEPGRYRLELTDEGLWFRAENGGEDYLRVPDPARAEPGQIDEKKEELKTFLGGGRIEKSLVGAWKGDGETAPMTLVLREDGGCVIVDAAEKGRPVNVGIGAWGVSDDGLFTYLVRRVGYADMPFDNSLRWEITPDGNLKFTAAEYAAETVVLTPAEVALYGRY